MPTIRASRLFSPQALRREVVSLYAKMTFTSGAYVLTDAIGVASVADTGTGIATLTLRGAYQSLVGFSFGILTADGAPPAVYGYLAAEAVSTASAPTVRLETAQVADGVTMTDPDEGDIVYVRLDLCQGRSLS